MQTVRLNMTPSGVMPHIYSSQYDKGRQFALQVYDDGGTFSIPDGAVVTLHGVKPDGKVFAYGSGDTDSVVSVADDLITITTTEQMTAVVGLTVCEIVVSKDDTTLASLNFLIDVEESVIPNDDKASASDLATYQEMINTAKDATTLAQQLIAIERAYTFHCEKRTFLVSNWVGDSAPFSYDLGAEFADKAIIVAPAKEATDLQISEWAQAQIFGDSGSKIYAMKQKPKTDIPVLMIWSQVFTEVNNGNK